MLNTFCTFQRVFWLSIMFGYDLVNIKKWDLVLLWKINMWFLLIEGGEYFLIQIINYINTYFTWGMIIVQILKYLIISLPFGGGSVVFPWIFLGFLVLGLIFGAMFEGVVQMGSCDPKKVCQH